MVYIDHFSEPDIEDNFIWLQTDSSKTSGGRINWQKTPRAETGIDGLVLHATGNPSQNTFGNDPWKYRGVRAHWVILPDGTVVQNHDANVYVNASHRLNRRSVAVEFVGNFRSERNRWWKGDKYGRDHLTRDQVLAGRWLVIYCREFLNISNVYTHRQSAKGKNCAGPDIWYHVGQWAVDWLGMGDGGDDYHVQGGAPIPEKWRTWDKPV